MGFRLCFALLAMAVVFSAALCAAAAAEDDDYGGALGMRVEQGQLNGSTGQQWSSPGGLEGEDEWALPSETARRFLQSGNHISYNALDKNKQAEGSDKGNSYTRQCGAGIYNCR